MSFCYADPHFAEEEAGQKAAEEFTLDQWSVVTRVQPGKEPEQAALGTLGMNPPGLPSKVRRTDEERLGVESNWPRQEQQTKEREGVDRGGGEQNRELSKDKAPSFLTLRGKTRKEGLGTSLKKNSGTLISCGNEKTHLTSEKH